MEKEIICPVCKKTDQLDWVGNILEKGTTNNNNAGVMFIPGEVIAPGFMHGTSMSQFIQRFVPPRKFGVPTIWSILGFLFLSIIFWAIFVNVVFFQTPFGFMWFFTAYLSLLPAIFLGIVSTVIIEVIRYAVGASKRKFWMYAHKRLWYSVYCERDNVIFSYDYYDHPQEYIRNLFNPIHRARRAVSYVQEA
jgi:hypothetical protein